MSDMSSCMCVSENCVNMARGKPWAEPKSSCNPTPLYGQRLNIENSQSVQREDCTGVLLDGFRLSCRLR